MFLKHLDRVGFLHIQCRKFVFTEAGCFLKYFFTCPADFEISLKNSIPRHPHTTFAKFDVFHGLMYKQVKRVQTL